MSQFLDTADSDHVGRDMVEESYTVMFNIRKVNRRQGFVHAADLLDQKIERLRNQPGDHENDVIIEAFVEFQTELKSFLGMYE